LKLVVFRSNFSALRIARLTSHTPAVHRNVIFVAVQYHHSSDCVANISHGKGTFYQ